MSCRCISDHPGALRRCIHHSLPGPILGPAFGIMVELHPEKFLHIFLPIYHLPHDESIRAY